MPADVGVNPDFDYLLDPQQAKPVGFCVRCGREIYEGNPHDVCWDCFEEVEYSMNESVELSPILRCTQPAVIDQNLMDLSANLLKITAAVKATPKIRENLPEIRKVRAELNKQLAALETQRKLVKAEVMLPYEQANKVYEAKVKAPIMDAENLCKAFIEEVETAVKKACEDDLRDYFMELCQSKGIFWLPFERMGIKVTLAMADQAEPKKAMEKIRQRVEQVEQDLSVISGMEDSVEVLAEYEQTLELSTAMSRVQNRKRAQEIAAKNREDRENAIKGQQEAAQRICAVAPDVVMQPQEKKYQTVFKVTATIPVLRGLKAFLESHNIEYQEVSE